MKKKISTDLIHGGKIRTEFMETSEPLFLTSGFIYKTAEEAEEAFKEKKKDFCIQDLETQLLKFFKRNLLKLRGQNHVGLLLPVWQLFLQFSCHISKRATEWSLGEHFLEVVITSLLKYYLDSELMLS